MNLKRLGTALIGGPIIIALLVLGNSVIIDILISIVAIRSIYEYSKCSENVCKSIKLIPYIPAIFIGFIHVIPKDIWSIILPIVIPLIILFYFLVVVITDGKISYKDLVYSFVGAFYLIPLIVYFSLLYGSINGKFLIWFIMFSAWGSDTFAYIVGKNLGKHKFSKISPNKTIEGCFAGILGAIILCLIYSVILNKFTDFDFEYWKIIIISAILSVVGQIGDFAASVIKRHFDVKDYSNLFPGHGGMIDRIDSIIFIAPFAYYFFVLL